MTEWIEALRAPVDADLSLLCLYLQSRGIDTYVFERDGMQHLCVPDGIGREQFLQAVADWEREGRFHSAELLQAAQHEARQQEAEAARHNSLRHWRQFPLTAALGALTLLVFLLLDSYPVEVIRWLAFQQVTIRGEELSVVANLPSLAEAWRYWTPALLHFSISHILFNAVLFWDFARRVERRQGSVRLLSLVLACGVLSNVAQFYAAPGQLFGGLSGVVYALIGYTWLYQQLRPQTGFVIPGGLVVMAVIWVLIGYTPLTESLQMGRMANAAHLGGLVAGLLCALLFIALDSSRLR